ncbi:MAG: DNA repair protein RecO [FCB group bacterium]|jgi:DNA repair protein RecO (recombination protein O)
MIVTTEAVVLKSRKYGDSSKIVSLFSKDEGKISIIAKGARQTKNKFGSSLNPLSYCSVQYYKKPQQELHTLSKAELIKPWNRLTESYEHLSCGLAILESLSLTIHENENNEELFAALINIFSMLNETENNPFAYFTSFQLQLASLLGFNIDFNTKNLQSNITANKKIYFSLESGLHISEQDRIQKKFFIFDIETYKILEEISMNNFESIKNIPLNEKAKRQIIDFFISYFSFHLDKKFYFRAFNLMKV